MESSDRTARIGLDVGATSTRLALVYATGDVYFRRRMATSKTCDPSAWTSWLARRIDDLLRSVDTDDRRYAAIGLALPGLVDANAGCLRKSINLPWLESYPIAAELTKKLGLSCALVSDADATTWGEYSAIGRVGARGGQLESVERFVHLRFGTGIACGFVAGGTLCVLDRTGCQHLEFLIVDRSSNAIACPCGLRGCLETLASGAAIARLTKETGLGTGVDDLRISFERGVRTAVQLVTRIRQGLELARVNIMAALSPQVIIIGGGVVDRFPALFEPLLDQCQESSTMVTSVAGGGHANVATVPPSTCAASCGVSKTSPVARSEFCTVRRGVCGDWAGVTGAAWLACSS